MNCRNCGMPLTGTKCEYCDTDYSAELKRGGIPDGKMLIHGDDDSFLDDFIPKKPRLVWDENGITLYADDRPIQTTPLSDTTIKAEVQNGWRWNV